MSSRDTGSDAAAPKPRVPLYVNVLESLGIQQEINRVARTLPDSTADIPAVDGESLHAVELTLDVAYRTAPTRTLTLNVHRPAGGGDRLRRAVVLFYGGGHVTDGDFETTEIWAQFLAERGFVAFNVHTRLLTEPGVTLPDIFADAITAVRFVITEGPRFGADPDRIAALGRSSGGQIALLVGSVPNPDMFGAAGDPNTPVHVRAIVAISASSDDARLYSSDELTLLQPAEIVAAYGGTPAEVPERYAQAAPLSYVRPGLPPLLLVHGKLDMTVPIGHALRLADAWEAAGNVVERDFQPDTGHVLGWGLFNNNGLGRALQVTVPFLEYRMANGE